MHGNTVNKGETLVMEYPYFRSGHPLSGCLKRDPFSPIPPHELKTLNRGWSPIVWPRKARIALQAISNLDEVLLFPYAANKTFTHWWTIRPSSGVILPTEGCMQNWRKGDARPPRCGDDGDFWRWLAEIHMPEEVREE